MLLGAPATRYVIKTLSLNDVKFLQIDAANAFNSISRQTILDEVILRVPSIARWVHYVYGKAAPLFFGDFVIFSREGTQQGDPLSLLSFSLALQPLLQELEAEFNTKFIVFYADDGTIIIMRQEAGNKLHFLETRGKDRGYIINRIKTKGWWFRIPAYIPNFNATIEQAAAIKVLGSPVSPDRPSTQIITSKRRDQEDLLTAIVELQDSHLAFHLMRYCASACRMIYALRTAPPHLTYAEAEYFDLQQRREFEKLHRQLSDGAWDRATLPFKYGGLGLTKTASLVEVAYVRSILNGWTLIQPLTTDILRLTDTQTPISATIQQPCAALRTRYNIPLKYSARALIARAQERGYISHLQEEYTVIIQGTLADALMPAPAATQRTARLQRARSFSNSTAEVVAVFSTVPSSMPHTQIPPHIWRTMVDLRFGNPLFTGTRPCHDCQTSQQNTIQRDIQAGHSPQTAPPTLLDSLGYHVATCKHGMGATRRHNRIKDTINVLLRDPAISLRPHLEWTFPSQSAMPQHCRERLDIIIDDLAFKDVIQAYDVTIVSPHNNTVLTAAARSAGGAAKKAELNKIRRYGDLCLQHNVAFTPIGMDIHGALGPHAKRAFRQMADFAATRKGTSPAAEYRRLTLTVVSQSLQLTASAVNRRMIHGDTTDITTAAYSYSGSAQL